MKHLVLAFLLGVALGLTGRVFGISPPVFGACLLGSAVLGQAITVFRAPSDRIRQAGAVALMIVIATVGGAVAAYTLLSS